MQFLSVNAKLDLGSSKLSIAIATYFSVLYSYQEIHDLQLGSGVTYTEKTWSFSMRFKKTTEQRFSQEIAM